MNVQTSSIHSTSRVKKSRCYDYLSIFEVVKVFFTATLNGRSQSSVTEAHQHNWLHWR